MKILENVPLAEYTTFKLGGPARYFCTVKKDGELMEAVQFAKQKKARIMVIGGGSNLLISDRGFPGMVIKNEYEGISMGDGHVIAGAGELWDELIDDVIDAGMCGLENLSAIPGTVGATPVQNIGAYGVDVSRIIESVKVLDTYDMKFKKLSNADCKFEYRDSLFKHADMKGRYIVTSVEYKLRDDGVVNIGYKDLKAYFEREKKSNPTPAEVRKAVIDIRWGKLPDWKLWGTAGSFFKNPVISAKQFAELKKQYPDLPGFPENNDENKVKVSLAWILDKICDAKNIRIGKVGVYEKQALVFVAHAGATASEVVELSNELMKRVKEKTGIDIEAEVEWVN